MKFLYSKTEPSLLPPLGVDLFMDDITIYNVSAHSSRGEFKYVVKQPNYNISGK